METIETPARCAAGKALALEKGSAGVRGRPGCEAVKRKGLLNFKATPRRVAIALRAVEAAAWLLVVATLIRAIMGGAR